MVPAHSPNSTAATSPVRALWSSLSITGSTFSVSWPTRKDQGIGHEFIRQLRAVGPDCSAQVGAEEHTDIPWQSQSGNTVRGVGGCVRRQLVDGLAAD